MCFTTKGKFYTMLNTRGPLSDSLIGCLFSHLLFMINHILILCSPFVGRRAWFLAPQRAEVGMQFPITHHMVLIKLLNFLKLPYFMKTWGNSNTDNLVEPRQLKIQDHTGKASGIVSDIRGASDKCPLSDPLR